MTFDRGVTGLRPLFRNPRNSKPGDRGPSYYGTPYTRASVIAPEPLRSPRSVTPSGSSRRAASPPGRGCRADVVSSCFPTSQAAQNLNVFEGKPRRFEAQKRWEFAWNRTSETQRNPMNSQGFEPEDDHENHGIPRTLEAPRGAFWVLSKVSPAQGGVCIAHFLSVRTFQNRCPSVRPPLWPAKRLGSRGRRAGAMSGEADTCPVRASWFNLERLASWRPHQ